MRSWDLLSSLFPIQQGMKAIVDITLAYPPDAPFAIDPFELLSLLRRHRQPLRIYFHVR